MSKKAVVFVSVMMTCHPSVQQLFVHRSETAVTQQQQDSSTQEGQLLEQTKAYAECTCLFVAHYIWRGTTHCVVPW